MKTYQILLTRSYVVTIDAKSEEDALFFSEFFVGGEKDLSNEKERKEKQFNINEIEMTMNEAIENIEIETE